MASHLYAYRVGRVSFDFRGTLLHRGDVIRGDDAIELEKPEHRHLLTLCARVRDSVFAHHDDKAVN